MASPNMHGKMLVKSEVTFRLTFSTLSPTPNLPHCNSSGVRKIKESDSSTRKVVRSPLGTRPLVLNDGNNKIVAGIAANATGPVLQSSANASQRGFVKGRQFIDNPVILDTHARIQDMQCMHSRGVYQFSSPLPEQAVLT